MERTYCVYKHTNRVNGKVYIGITSQKPRDRWDSGWGYQRNKHFWDAIQKYGWDNFDHDILFNGLSQEEAFVKERELIAEYESLDYRKGYNMTPGGESGPCFSGEAHPMWGKHHSSESRAKMSVTRTGKPWSDERRKSAMKPQSIERRREVALRTIAGYNKGKCWDEESNRKRSESNRGQKRSLETCRRIGESKKKPVLQFTRDGVFLREWDSGRTAGTTLGIHPGHISKVCKNERKTAGGYVWRYKP